MCLAVHRSPVRCPELAHGTEIPPAPRAGATPGGRRREKLQRADLRRLHPRPGSNGRRKLGYCGNRVGHCFSQKRAPRYSFGRVLVYPILQIEGMWVPTLVGGVAPPIVWPVRYGPLGRHRSPTAHGCRWDGPSRRSRSGAGNPTPCLTSGNRSPRTAARRSPSIPSTRSGRARSSVLSAVRVSPGET